MTEPYYSDPWVTLLHGDCLDVLATLPANSVDAVVTDPPYGLEFMGKEWDKFGDSRQPFRGEIQTPDNPYGRSTVRFAGTGSYGAKAAAMRAFQDWCNLWSVECLRVLKPGGHMLAFGGTRTWHRLSCAIEDAGFEIRDSIAWLYGSGFPKSLDVSKAIDKAAGAEREVVGQGVTYGSGSLNNRSRVEHGYRPTELRPDGGVANVTAPATPGAVQWQGWGTALKPAFEPIVVARKPLAGTVAANVLEHGTGALNIDGCRIGTGEDRASGGVGAVRSDIGPTGIVFKESRPAGGRWPANVALDATQAKVLDQMSGDSASVASVRKRAGTTAGNGETLNHYAINADNTGGFDDAGGASRFFYTAKADSNERPRINGIAHPTVKPLNLMRWLVRLITPPGGKVLDPFAGSGTTGEAALLEGLASILIERETDYLPLIRHRITRRRDPIANLRDAGQDLGLFGEATA